MLDHVGLEVSDYERSRDFYLRALQPLGYELLMEPIPQAGGFGRRDDEFGGKPVFWIAARGGPTAGGTHVAFTAPENAVVDAFHAAALAAGGSDNGESGPRPIYHPGYYGGYVLDPDGNNVEAVCHNFG